ncbi:MAG: DNA adenine methylase [Candidatus Micrarchaeaceae archaeon]
MKKIKNFKVKILFPYYGGRSHQINEIIQIMAKHYDEFEVVVDVFGGSAKVLLNIPLEWRKMKVYNDVDKDLYITFKVLQDKQKREELIEKINLSFAHENIFNELKESKPNNDIDIAFKTIYLFSYSYNSVGEAFKREYKYRKLPKPHFEFVNILNDWIIENKDFRELMDLYNKPTVLLYLDPPYLTGGKKYKYQFDFQDFLDLRYKLQQHKGTYLMNLSMYDKSMVDIFGKPNMVAEYSLSTVNTEEGTRPKWQCGYWWKFKTP